jgi:hypothetical protein
VVRTFVDARSGRPFRQIRGFVSEDAFPNLPDTGPIAVDSARTVVGLAAWTRPAWKSTGAFRSGSTRYRGFDGYVPAVDTGTIELAVVTANGARAFCGIVGDRGSSPTESGQPGKP